VNQTVIARITTALLVILVALPLLFIVLQALFPHFSAGSLRDPFSAIPHLLAEPQLPAMFSGSCKSPLVWRCLAL
jgi:iron(III) transport system permease protein